MCFELSDFYKSIEMKGGTIYIQSNGSMYFKPLRLMLQLRNNVKMSWMFETVYENKGYFYFLITTAWKEEMEIQIQW